MNHVEWTSAFSMGDSCCQALEELSLSLDRSEEYQVTSKSNGEALVSVKNALRDRVWKRLQLGKCLRPYPPSPFGKIPNFKGCHIAAKRVAELSEFQAANVIKVNPSLAQMDLRLKIMKSKKKLVVASPALTQMPDLQTEGAASEKDVFCFLLDGNELSPRDLKFAQTKKGSVTLGKPLLTDWKSVGHIDIVVVGAVVVSRNGCRLGKGMGFAELEWAILYELGVVDQSTLVFTTVHEKQIVRDSEMCQSQPFDLPVDVIVTPNRVIRVEPRPKKPDVGILWNEISEEKLDVIPILKFMKDRQK